MALVDKINRKIIIPLICIGIIDIIMLVLHVLKK